MLPISKLAFNRTDWQKLNYSKWHANSLRIIKEKRNGKQVKPLSGTRHKAVILIKRKIWERALDTGNVNFKKTCSTL